MLLELVDIVGDARPRLVLAEVVRQIDVDGLSHSCDVGQCSALFKHQHKSMILMMKWIAATIAALFATAAVGQPVQPTLAVVQPAPWDPVRPYITAGQDEPGYRSWYLAAPSRAAEVKSFNDYLLSAQVSGI